MNSSLSHMRPPSGWALFLSHQLFKRRKVSRVGNQDAHFKNNKRASIPVSLVYFTKVYYNILWYIVRKNNFDDAWEEKNETFA